jgi:hypothetical protein
MKTTSPYSEAIRHVVAKPTGGIAGLVDELLAMCQEHGLQIDWRADRCRVRSPKGDWEELGDLQVRKSVFRAILARVAALCNDQNPNSLSPYGGHGELLVGANPGALFRVTMANTPGEQALELIPVPAPSVPARSEETSCGAAAGERNGVTSGRPAN